MVYRGKERRMGRGYAKMQNWKKAIVTLKQGDEIEFFDEESVTMGIKNYKPTSPGRRFYSVSDFADITKTTPEKRLVEKQATGGRNNMGRITSRFRGGGHKQRYRIIDFKRDKIGVPAKVASIEYDPNRTARIALLHYADGEKRYILAPDGLKVGDRTVLASRQRRHQARATRCRSADIPLGTMIHNIELKKGKGGQLVRSAGTRRSSWRRTATTRRSAAERRGPQGPPRLPRDHRPGLQPGARQHQPRQGRPQALARSQAHNRGVTMNPVDHPMGGGEGAPRVGVIRARPGASSPRARRRATTSAPTSMIVRRRNSKG
jgi:large subunit ribosomal protein L2